MSAKYRLLLGEAVRWYLTRARHPFKNYVVGHYWRLFSRPLLWVQYQDGVIGIRLEDYLQQRIFFEGCYERRLIDWLNANLQTSDLFWDVGANIGAVTLVAARLCHRAVAFEPDPRSLELLKQNLLANDIRNVDIVAAALGRQSGTAVLYQASPENTGMTSVLPGRGSTVGQMSVAMMRADDFVAKRPELAPTVMKLDVEGAEHLVLDGANELLQAGRLRAVIFEDRRDTHAQPANHEAVAILKEARYGIQPFGASDAELDDGMYNFLATPAVLT